MKLISCNVRGCNALDKHCLIKRGLEQMKPDLICLQETKLNLEVAEGLLRAWWSWLGFFSSALGASDGLGIVWNPSLINVEEIFKNQAWQLCRIHANCLNCDFFLINVYGLRKANLQLETWR